MITVLMPVYNAAPFIWESLQSVLAGLSAGDEVLIVDDGSTDGSQHVAKSIADKRIRHIQNSENIGVATTLNRGLSMARGNFIARMDADDICRNDRFTAQAKFLESHPEIGLVGGWVRYLGKHHGALERKPTGSACIKAFLLFDNPIVHPTVMFRRDVIEAHSLFYDPTYSRSEDLDMWVRCSKHMAIDNIPKVLIDFRVHEASVTQIARAEMESQSIALMRRQLASIGIDADDRLAQLHRRIGHGEVLRPDELQEAEGWLLRIFQTASDFPGYTPEGLLQASRQVWMRLCLNNACHGLWTMRCCLASTLCSPKDTDLEQFLRLVVACLWHSCRRIRQ